MTMRKVLLGKHNDSLVPASVQAKWVTKQCLDGSHWFVRVEPTPTTVMEKCVAWIVRNFTPHWDIIESVRRINLPLSAEEAGAIFGASIAEKKSAEGTTGRDVMVLQIAEEPFE